MPRVSARFPVDGSIDATRISVPVMIAIAIGSTLLSTVLTIGGTYWALRGDVRDMGTRMEFYAKQLDKVDRQNMLLQQDVTEIREHDISDIKMALASAGLLRANVTITTHPGRK